MCLLISKPAHVTFSDEWLRDFYASNSDGYGMMWAEDDTLYHVKDLGTVEDFIATFRAYEDKPCAIHLRMRTHGDVDLENCHPYTIFSGDDPEGPMYLMHNGILSTGNDADKTKSDTWHFVNDYLRPMLRGRPELMFEPAFQKMLGTFVGSSNKFVVMDYQGNQAIVNKSSGVDWNEAWMSNTYAWSAEKAGVKTPYYSYPRTVSSKAWSYDYDDDEFSTKTLTGSTTSTALVQQGTSFQKEVNKVVYTPYAYEDEDDLDAASMFASDLFDYLYEDPTCKYLDLLGTLTTQDVEEFYYKVGINAAYDLADAVMDGWVSPDTVSRCVQEKSVSTLYGDEDYLYNM